MRAGGRAGGWHLQRLGGDGAAAAGGGDGVGASALREPRELLVGEGGRHPEHPLRLAVGAAERGHRDDDALRVGHHLRPLLLGRPAPRRRLGRRRAVRRLAHHEEGFFDPHVLRRHAEQRERLRRERRPPLALQVAVERAGARGDVVAEEALRFRRRARGGAEELLRLLRRRVLRHHRVARAERAAQFVGFAKREVIDANVAPRDDASRVSSIGTQVP